MNADRSGLSIDVVAERMSEAERLLQEATRRVAELSESSGVAGRTATSLSESARAVEEAARSLGLTAAAMDEARVALSSALDLAKQFLAATDVSAVVERLDALESRLSQQRDSDVIAQADLLAKIDRVSELEAERDAYRSRLESVMSQLPPRVAKKVT